MEQLLPKNAIYLDEEVKAEYPTVEISSEDPTSLNFRQHKNLRPLCFHCGSHNLSYGQKYFWHRCASFRHFFCYYCFDHSLKRFNHTCVDGKPILDECKTIEHLLCGKIKFECKWPNCKKIFGGSTLRSHELSCELQPVRECPVSECSWTGRLDLMEKEHFKEHQQAKMILRNVVLKVESDREYYLLILDKFVKVTYVIQELGEVFEHQISLEVCKEELSYAKPVGLVTVNHLLLKKIDGGGAVKSVRKNVILFVYFENK